MATTTTPTAAVARSSPDTAAQGVQEVRGEIARGTIMPDQCVADEFAADLVLSPEKPKAGGQIAATPAQHGRDQQASYSRVLSSHLAV